MDKKKNNHPKATYLIGLLIAWVIGIYGVTLMDTPFLHGQEFRDDCNLILYPKEKLPTSLGFFTPDDIIKAYDNTIANCPPRKTDGNLLPSTYMFDHLLMIWFAKLSWEAESIWLTSDPAGLAIKQLREKVLVDTNSTTITTIPAALQQEYDAIRNKTWTYLPQLAQAGVYSWSTWLYSKYMALCDLTRGVYLRVQDVTKVKQGTTSYIVDNSYQQCIQTIEEKLGEVIDKQWAMKFINAQSVTLKIKEAINQDSKEQLNTLMETTEKAKNSFNDVSKKIDQSIQNCNITDV